MSCYEYISSCCNLFNHHSNTDFRAINLIDIQEGGDPIQFPSNTDAASTDHNHDDMSKSVDTNKNTNNSSTKPSSTLQGECPICLEKFTPYDTIYSTDCNHLFCSECITYALHTNDIGAQSSCPICRKAIKHMKLIQQAATPLTSSSSSSAVKQQSKHKSNNTYQSFSNTDTDADKSWFLSHSNTPSDILVVHVKYNRQIYDVPVSTSIRYTEFRNQLAKLFHADKQFMKIVHKGSIVLSDQQLANILYSGMSNREEGVYVMFQLIAAITHTPQDSKWSDSTSSTPSSCIIQ